MIGFSLRVAVAAASFAVVAGHVAAQAEREAGAATAEIEMTVRRGDGMEAVRITRFTPRMAAVEALDGAMENDALPAGQPQILGLSAAWHDPLRSLFGVDATLAFSGAVASDAEGSGAGSGLAFGATLSTLGVDLSGRLALSDGEQDDALSFGASTAVGGWTLGGAITLQMNEDGGAGARLGASYLAAPGLLLGGGIDFADEGDEGPAGGRGVALPGGGSVGAGVSVRLDF